MTTTATKAQNLHPRIHGCCLDVSKPKSSNYWCLEIDFIYATHQPDDLGMSLIFQACIMAGASHKQVTQFGLRGSCYTSAHFRSRRQALRAAQWVEALIEEFWAQGIGLTPRGAGKDRYQDLLFATQPD